MTEAYTAGGDSWQTAKWPDRAAQTFRPKKTHTLLYVDLQLKTLFLPTTIDVQIQGAGSDHKPDGIMISDAYGFRSPGLIPFLSKRVRFKMRPVTLNKDQYYAIVVHGDGNLIYGILQWHYNAGDAEYGRGVRSSTDDGGVTWTVYTDDDHIFAEFGTPPAPNIPAPPPIENFIPTLYNSTDFFNHVCISLATNVPCHLTCYWTPNQPKKHPITRVVRGLNVPWYTYFCFTGWHAHEQEEPGDTLYHSFLLPDWPLSQKRYFTFRGDVDGILSPSVGPIFDHTNEGGPPYAAIFRPNAPGDHCTIPREIGEPCPDHWKNLDDVTPDEDTTCVMSWDAAASWYKEDLYRIPNLPPSDRLIAGITVTARIRRQGGRTSTYIAKIILKTHGMVYRTNAMNLFPTYYVNRSWLHSTNPNTGLPWTLQEINDLQIGVASRFYRGVGWSSVAYITQVYVQVWMQCQPVI